MAKEAQISASRVGEFVLQSTGETQIVVKFERTTGGMAHAMFLTSDAYQVWPIEDNGFVTRDGQLLMPHSNV